MDRRAIYALCARAWFFFCCIFVARARNFCICRLLFRNHQCSLVVESRKHKNSLCGPRARVRAGSINIVINLQKYG